MDNQLISVISPMISRREKVSFWIHNFTILESSTKVCSMGWARKPRTAIVFKGSMTAAKGRKEC